MADNFLEKHQIEYEYRKRKWLMKKRHLSNIHIKENIPKQEDESL